MADNLREHRGTLDVRGGSADDEAQLAQAGEAAAPPPVLILPDGTAVAGDVIVAQVGSAVGIPSRRRRMSRRC